MAEETKIHINTNFFLNKIIQNILQLRVLKKVKERRNKWSLDWKETNTWKS